ncbi:hypothetical protein EV175_004935 [Coemansia sp. RSA 1933]|nr:hypothetical protein EV175_004935 [Coemansia sp. RSA 1933]
MNLRRTRIGLALALAISVAVSARSSSVNDDISDILESITLDKSEDSAHARSGSSGESTTTGHSTSPTLDTSEETSVIASDVVSLETSADQSSIKYEDTSHFTTTTPLHHDSSVVDRTSSYESVTTDNHLLSLFTLDTIVLEDDTGSSVSDSTVLSSFVEEATSDTGASSVASNISDYSNSPEESFSSENESTDGHLPFTTTTTSDTKHTTTYSTPPTNSSTTDTTTSTPIISILTTHTSLLDILLDSQSDELGESVNADSGFDSFSGTTTTIDVQSETTTTAGNDGLLGNLVNNLLGAGTTSETTPSEETTTSEHEVSSVSSGSDVLDSNSFPGFTTILEDQVQPTTTSTTTENDGLLGNVLDNLLGQETTTSETLQSEAPTISGDLEGSDNTDSALFAEDTTALEDQSDIATTTTTEDGGLLGNLLGNLLGQETTTSETLQREAPTISGDLEGSDNTDSALFAEDTTALEDQSDMATTTTTEDGGLLGNLVGDLLGQDTTTSEFIQSGDIGVDGSTEAVGEDTTTPEWELDTRISWPEISWPEVSWPEISWPEITWPGDGSQADSDSDSGLSIVEVPTESQDDSTDDSPFLPPWFETSTAASFASDEEFTTGDTFSIESAPTDELADTSGDAFESTELVTSSWVSPIESEEVETSTLETAEEVETSALITTSTPTPTLTTSSSTSTTKGVISVPTSVDFSRLTAEPTTTASASDSADANDNLPQVVTNPLSSTCSQCLTFTLRILAPYANLFGSNNYLASQAFNQIPNLVATALGINDNRVTASMIYAQADAVVAANRRRSLLVRDTEPAYPHYYISLSITKDSSAVNPKSELQLLSTSLSSQVRDASSQLHTLNSWGPLIDRTYMVVTSNLDDLNGVAQVAPDSPGQVDSPLQSNAKSASRSKWIGVGVGVSCAVVLAVCILLVHYRRRHHMLSKRQIRQNFVAIQ